ncbi:MAG: MmcQ/YjbR family DNA-binding protein [Oscillospiraceae bacterium]
MTRRELIEYCLTFPDAYEDYPFRDNGGSELPTAAMRHRLNGKVFALILERGGLCANLKCEPFRADFLRRVYEGVTPGFHMNKEHWNSVFPNSDVPEDELHAMIYESWQLTRPKSRKADAGKTSL